ncbi:MAG: stage III sporulation protein AB [Eubacterium sp.]|nr:stage III sporulation protein AB [Eubacterium sp.]
MYTALLVKLSGCFVMIFSSFVLGEYFALRSRLRLSQLYEMKMGISLLSADIEMNLTPAAVSALKTAGRLKEPVSEIFKTFGEKLKEGERVERAWGYALNKNAEKTFLKEEDIEGLSPLGKILECLDVERQEKGLEAVRGYIDRKTAELEGEFLKNQKLYRSISLLGGIFTAVVLF